VTTQIHQRLELNNSPAGFVPGDSNVLLTYFYDYCRILEQDFIVTSGAGGNVLKHPYSPNTALI